MKITFTFLCLGFAAILPLRAGAIDCSKKLSKVERLICDDKSLLTLDQSLNLIFTAKMQDIAIKAFLPNVQKEWLRRRDLCENAACLKAKYTQQLTLLEKLDPKVCDVFLEKPKLFNELKLKQKYNVGEEQDPADGVTKDLDGDGIKEVLIGRNVGGTCAAMETEVYSPDDLKKPIFSSEYRVEPEEGGFWMGTEFRYYTYLGLTYQIAHSLRDQQLYNLSVVLPHNGAAVICNFTHELKNTVDVRKDSKPLCKAALAKTLKPLELKNKVKATDQSTDNAFTLDEFTSAPIELITGEPPVRVARELVSSGAGCGCESSFPRFLPAKGTRPLLQKWYSNAECDETAEIVGESGKYYLLVKDSSNGAPKKLLALSEKEEILCEFKTEYKIGSRPGI